MRSLSSGRATRGPVAIAPSNPTSPMGEVKKNLWRNDSTENHHALEKAYLVLMKHMPMRDALSIT